MRLVAWLMLFCSLLLPAVLAFFLPFSERYGLVAGRSAGYGGKEIESGRHVLGGAVLVVGTVAGILSVPLGCARMLLLPGGMFHFGGGLRQVEYLPARQKGPLNTPAENSLPRREPLKTALAAWSMKVAP